MPGKGFFKMARSLGHDMRAEHAFWKSELKKVHDYWATN